MIGRRAVLGGLAAMTTTWGDPGQRPAGMEGRGGNPPMRPDQAAAMRALSSAGSGPAPQNAFILAQRVVIFGTGNARGLFVYSGSPSGPPTGNLVYSITQATADPYGNPTLPGATSYSATGVTNENGGVTLVYAPTAALGNLIASVAPAAGTDSFGNAYVQGHGGYVTSVFHAVLGGSNLTAFTSTAPGDTGTRWNVGRDGTINWGPGNAAADVALARSAAAQLGLTAGAFVSTAGTAANPSKFLTDTWQTLGTLAGYTVNIGRFRLTTDNCVELDIKATGGGAQAQTVSFSVTLPAAYRPATQHDTLPMGTTKAIAAGDIWPRLLVTTAGVVTVNATPNSATTIACCQKVPLD